MHASVDVRSVIVNEELQFRAVWKGFHEQSESELLDVLIGRNVRESSNHWPFVVENSVSPCITAYVSICPRGERAKPRIGMFAAVCNGESVSVKIVAKAHSSTRHNLKGGEVLDVRYVIHVATGQGLMWASTVQLFVTDFNLHSAYEEANTCTSQWRLAREVQDFHAVMDNVCIGDVQRDFVSR